LHAKQVNSDNSQAVRAQSDSRRLDVDSTALRVRREDQDSIRVQGGASSNASALSVEPEVSRVRRANQENATVGQAEPAAHAREIGQENSRTQAIKTDDARAAGVDSDDPPLNRFDWDGARNAVSSTRVDRLLAVPTLAEPPTHKAVPQAAVPASVKPGVSALDATQREALFQEFLRWQERQGVRWIGTSSTR
jgi:hypothetical protein